MFLSRDSVLVDFVVVPGQNHAAADVPADGEQEGVGTDAVRHPQGPVNHLGNKPDEDKNENVLLHIAPSLAGRGDGSASTGFRSGGSAAAPKPNSPVIGK